MRTIILGFVFLHSLLIRRTKMLNFNPLSSICQIYSMPLTFLHSKTTDSGATVKVVCNKHVPANVLRQGLKLRAAANIRHSNTKRIYYCNSGYLNLYSFPSMSERDWCYFAMCEVRLSQPVHTILPRSAYN